MGKIVDRAKGRHRSRASRLEYHVFARFPGNSCGVRVGTTLTERTAQRVGNAIYPLADEVWYKIHARRPGTKPHRPPRHW